MISEIMLTVFHVFNCIYFPLRVKSSRKDK